MSATIRFLAVLFTGLASHSPCCASVRTSEQDWTTEDRVFYRPKHLQWLVDDWAISAACAVGEPFARVYGEKR
jgi:hypothetical protein